MNAKKGEAAEIKGHEEIKGTIPGRKYGFFIKKSKCTVYVCHQGISAVKNF